MRISDWSSDVCSSDLSLPADAGTQMQAGMERFTKAKSLNAILAELQKIAPAVAAAPQVSVTVNAASAAAPTIDYAGTLTALVAERTGYPYELLAFDARPEERRVGKGCVSTLRSRWSRCH